MSTTTIAMLNSLTPFALANMADASADNQEAQDFYSHIRDAFTEALEELEDDETEVDQDRLSEIADGAPDVYNHTRMMELIGTRTYLDTSDLATGEEDILTLAGYVLYDLAQTLLAALQERVNSF